MQQIETSHRRTVFVTVWFTQLISALGTGLTEFALGVHVYQRTGSTTQFAMVMVCAMLPVILMSPFSGALADRFDRRLMMVASNVGSGLVILVLVLVSHRSLGLIYASVVALAICGALRDPAYYASVSQMVSKEQLGRASGLVQTAENVGSVAPPFVAGVLLVTVGLDGVLHLDLISYAVGVLALMMVRFPPLDRSTEDDTKPSLWRDTVVGWRYITTHRGFLYLFLFGSFTSFCVGLAQVVVTPLVLSFGSAAVLGATYSTGALGILVGGLVMAAWGGPERRARGVLIFGLVQAGCLILASVRPNAALIAAGLFGYLFSIQVVRACIATIIRVHVPDTMQARVFALSRFVGWSTLPLAYVLSGPLVNLFTPLLMPDGALAGSAGQLIGTGSGRGMGFLLFVLGCGFLLVVLFSYANPRLRHVEDEMRALEARSEAPVAEPVA
jgi:MFS transporter, DHA3 family, macrolide efflux protein